MALSAELRAGLQQFYNTALSRFGVDSSLRSTDVFFEERVLTELHDKGMLLEDPDEKGSYWLSREGVIELRNGYEANGRPTRSTLNEFAEALSRLPLVEFKEDAPYYLGVTERYVVDGRNYNLTKFESDGMVEILCLTTTTYMPYSWWDELVCKSLEARGLFKPLQYQDGWMVTGDALYIFALINGTDIDTVKEIEDAPAPTVNLTAPTFMEEVMRIGISGLRSADVSLFTKYSNAWYNLAVLHGYSTPSTPMSEEAKHAYGQSYQWTLFVLYVRNSEEFDTRALELEMERVLRMVSKQLPQELGDVFVMAAIEAWMEGRS